MTPPRFRVALWLPALGFAAGALLFGFGILIVGLALCMASLAALALTHVFATCAGCGKSPYERLIRWRGRPALFPKAWGAPWPERRCSRCGLEVGAAPD